MRKLVFPRLVLLLSEKTDEKNYIDTAEFLAGVVTTSRSTAPRRRRVSGP